jgi:hypothetical protein
MSSSNVDEKIKPYIREIGKVLYATNKPPLVRVRDDYLTKWLAAIGTFVIWLAGVYTVIKLSLTIAATWPLLPFAIFFVCWCSWYLLPRVRKLYASDSLVVGDKGIVRILQKGDGRVLKASPLIFDQSLNFEFSQTAQNVTLRIQQGKIRWFLYTNKSGNPEQSDQLQAAYDSMFSWKAKQRLLNDKTPSTSKR